MCMHETTKTLAIGSTAFEWHNKDPGMIRLLKRFRILELVFNWKVFGNKKLYYISCVRTCFRTRHRDYPWFMKKRKRWGKVDQVKLPTLILLMVTLFIGSAEFGAQFFVESAIVSEINGPARNHSSCEHEDPKNFASFVACSFYLAMPWQRGHGLVSMFIQEIEPSKNLLLSRKKT